MKKIWAFHTSNELVRAESQPRTPDQYGALNGLIAIDPGKSVGWSFHSKDGVEAFGFVDAGDKYEGNCLLFAESIMRACPPSRVGIEESSIFAGCFANKTPIEVAAIFRAMAQNEGVEILKAAPSSVKKFLGDGRMKKGMVRKVVQERCPDLPKKYPHNGKERVWPFHIYDSIALGMYLSSR